MRNALDLTETETCRWDPLGAFWGEGWSDAQFAGPDETLPHRWSIGPAGGASLTIAAAPGSRLLAILGVVRFVGIEQALTLTVEGLDAVPERLSLDERAGPGGGVFLMELPTCLSTNLVVGFSVAPALSFNTVNPDDPDILPRGVALGWAVFRRISFERRL